MCGVGRGDMLLVLVLSELHVRYAVRRSCCVVA